MMESTVTNNSNKDDKVRNEEKDSPEGQAESKTAPPSAETAAASSPGSAKRTRDEIDSMLDDGGDIDPSKMATLSRSERKRYREKKRRSDVNKGFDDLMNLLIEIDPAVRAEAEERARRGQWKGTIGAQEDNLLSRVDLISRSVQVLRRLHHENEQRKGIIDQLIQESTRRVDLSRLQEASIPSQLRSTGNPVSDNDLLLSRLLAAQNQAYRQPSALSQLALAESRAAIGASSGQLDTSSRGLGLGALGVSPADLLALRNAQLTSLPTYLANRAGQLPDQLSISPRLQQLLQEQHGAHQSDASGTANRLLSGLQFGGVGGADLSGAPNDRRL